MPSSRTDFFVDMSGQTSSRRRQLSTKQWSGNKRSDVPTKIQTSSYAMDHRDWSGTSKQWRAERQACCWTRLTARFSQTVNLFWKIILSIFCVLNVSFLFQNSTSWCRQNRIFVDMSYFLKIAVLSPSLSTKLLSTTALCKHSIAEPDPDQVSISIMMMALSGPSITGYCTFKANIEYLQNNLICQKLIWNHLLFIGLSNKEIAVVQQSTPYNNISK